MDGGNFHLKRIKSNMHGKNFAITILYIYLVKTKKRGNKPVISVKLKKGRQKTPSFFGFLS